MGVQHTIDSMDGQKGSIKTATLYSRDKSSWLTEHVKAKLYQDIAQDRGTCTHDPIASFIDIKPWHHTYFSIHRCSLDHISCLKGETSTLTLRLKKTFQLLGVGGKVFVSNDNPLAPLRGDQ